MGRDVQSPGWDALGSDTMILTDWLYITENRALELGFTHSGGLYGVPAWVAEDGEDDFIACPKLTILQLYAIAIDTLFEWMTYLLPEDCTVETPITLGRKL